MKRKKFPVTTRFKIEYLMKKEKKNSIFDFHGGKR